MMSMEESEAEADRILSEAGWTTTLKPPWNGRHVAPGLVGGRAPDGNAYAKAYAAFAQSESAAMGLDPADYPDEPHEAAAWLAERYKAPEQPATASIPVDALEYRMPAHLSADQFDPQPEASETPQDETHGETGEDANGEPQGAGPDHASSAQSGYEPGSAGIGLADGEEPIDADFEPIPDLPDLSEIELIPPDPDPDFGAELLEFEQDTEPKEDAPSGAFIFGDNIDQKRTAAIGLVVQAAILRMPPPIDYAVLSEARNFAMGVAEGRWPDNAAAQAELAELEARERRRRAIETARDDKTAFLVAATREQIEAFDPESDWP